MSILDKQAKKKRVMEYKSAPSGKVTLYNYKDPLMEYVNGYGYYGVLLFDVETDKVQCHLCGKWFDALGAHLNKFHYTNAEEYKYLVGLNRNTALISEKARNKMVSSGQERFKNLTPGVKMTQEVKDKISKGVTEGSMRLDAKNKHENCPLQILDQLADLADKLDRAPTQEECKGLYDNLVNVYGDFQTACEMAGVTARKNGENIRKKGKKRTDMQLIKLLVAFYEKHDRWPSGSDYRRELLPHRSVYLRRFGSLEEAQSMAKVLINKK